MALNLGTVNLRFTTTGAEKTQQDMTRVEGAAKRLSTALKGIGFGLVAREVIQLLDANTRLNGQLALVARNNAELAASQRIVREIAKDTRQPLEEIGSLYVRVAQASEELGLSQAEVATLTRAVGNAIRVSGSSAGAAQGAMMQLGQALSAGTVRAEEFNSILEGMPAFARAVAKEILGPNGTAAALRQLVVDGRLSSQELARGALAAEKALTAAANRMPQTIGEAFTAVRNELITLMGDLDTNGAFSKTITGFAAMVANLARGVADFVLKVTGAIQRMIGFFAQGIAQFLDGRVLSSLPLLRDIDWQGLATWGNAQQVEGQQLQNRVNNRGRGGAAPALGGGGTRLRGDGAGGARVGMAAGLPGVGLMQTSSDGRTLAGMANDTLFNVLGIEPRNIAPAMAELTRTLVARLQEVERMAGSAAQGIGQAIADGLATALNTGNIGEGIKALGASLLASFGSLLQQLGMQGLAANKLFASMLTFLGTPAGIGAALGLIALGGLLQGGAGLLGRSGSNVSAGGTQLGGGRGLPTIIDRGTIAAAGPSAPRVSGDLRAPSASVVNVAVIGPNDPMAQRQISELIANAQRRGL